MNNELKDISDTLRKIQRDIRTIAEALNARNVDFEEHNDDPDAFIERIKLYHANGLSNLQISKMLGIDFWIVCNITDAYDKEMGVSE